MLFGFLGPFAGSPSAASLEAYGTRVAAAAPRDLSGPGVRPYGCWAPLAASQDGVTAMVQGQPIIPHRPPATSESADPATQVLELYRESGADFPRSLRGHFAIAIVDSRAGRVVLAIDPMGIERLAYAVRGDGLVFSSSAEAVARHHAVAACLSPQALFDYLMLHMVPAPTTVFAGVSKLRPSTFAVFEHGRIRIDRLWTPRFIETGGESFSTLATDLHAALRTAVRSCEPDAACGAFLSGRLDSSTVTGVLSEVGPRPAKTFSIGFGYPDYDELPFARITSDHFACKPHEYTVTGEDIAAAFPKIAHAFDEPFGNSSALPAYYCARVAHAQGVQHLLAGDGGDELFAGNSRYVEQQVFEHYQRVPHWLRSGLLEPLVARWSHDSEFWPIRKARGYIEQANTPLPARLEAWNFLRRLGPAEIVDPELLASIDMLAPLARMQEVWDAAPCTSTLGHMLYYDWHYTLADNDLRKVETMARLADVRVSYPMLHPAVVDLSLRVPPQMMMVGSRLRDFYKRAMQGFLPGAIIQKKKHGFGLPFGLWLQDSATLRELILGNLSDLRRRRVIRGEFLNRLLHLHGNDDARYYGVFVWVLAMLEQWFKEHEIGP